MAQWQQGPCECTNDVGLCFYSWCCLCLAVKEAADNIDDPNGLLFCLATFPCGCGCCALTLVGDKVAEKRGIEQKLCTGAFKSCCTGLTCYACTVVKESRLHKQEQAKKAVGVHGQQMQRN
ncbi:expressed unknown protein [Seminavis robusta]|uniref:Uncharacterized protein n=1 Tax=Seminavis robusta TaxID=568900 RepID=A0A9N8DHG9_9STRA|nr:expressed unknown protein [Seminavis robusta]|eukprot:Sro130_g061820.1 n/a (121) ;mRNA; r:25097-25459